MTMDWEREISHQDTNTTILSRQKNSESKHLEGQKALDEKHFCPVPYSKIMSPNTSLSTPLTHVDKHIDQF